MSWTLRVDGHNRGQARTWDCKKTPTDAIIEAHGEIQDGHGGQDMAASMVRLPLERGRPGAIEYVQGVFAGSAAGLDETTFELSLPNNPRVGSTIILDILFETIWNNVSIRVEGGGFLTPPRAQTWPTFWLEDTAYSIGDSCIDFWGHVQEVVSVNLGGFPVSSGRSGFVCPTWANPPVVGDTTIDGDIATGQLTWQSQVGESHLLCQLNGGSGSYILTTGCYNPDPTPFTVLITMGAGTGPHTFGDITCALSEYAGVEQEIVFSTRTSDFVSGSPPSVELELPAEQAGDAYHLATILRPYFAGAAPIATGGGDPLEPLEAWLVMFEDGEYVDQTERMFYGDGHQNSFTSQLRQRGTATVHLIIHGDDDYEPIRGGPIYLYDRTDADGYVLVFAGFIQDIENQWLGTGGDHYVIISAVSLESVFDTVYASPVGYENQTCDVIIADLYERFATGCGVALGTISTGALIPRLVTNYEKLSELFDQLALTSGLTWWVDPATQLLNFTSPSLVPAPIVLTDSDVLWESFNWKASGSDYRNRQAVRADYDAFAQSGEFIVGAGQTQITLSRPVQQVTNAYATLSTCNTATGTFTGQPADGDTITIQPASGAWQAAHVYALGGVIVINGFVQKVTTAGTSGGSQPTFSTVTGNTTVDNTVIWTCLGPLGLGTDQQSYTFRSVIDNTEFGEVLIGATFADTAQNFVDAINATVTRAGVQLRGVTYSLPTWENGQVNAINLVGGVFTAQTKSAGTGWVTALSEGATNFVWSSANTTGGTSPQGSLGPGYGATISLQVYVAGTSVAAPGLSYTPGSAVVNLATPLNVGSNLNVFYTRPDGNVIEVEDTAQVIALAAITGGTGKVQQIQDASQQGLISNSSAGALQIAQESLLAYSTIPKSFDFRTYYTGLGVGQQLEVLMTLPTGGVTLLDGTWVILGVDGDLVPCWPSLGPYGHYQYTVHLVNIEEVGSYLDFWAGLGGGGSGGGSGTVATSGGAQTSTPSALELATDGVTNGDQTLLDLVAGTNVTLTDDGNGHITIDATGGGGTGTAPLFTRYANVGSVASGETTLYSNTVPGGSVSAAGSIMFARYAGTLVNSTSTKRIRVYFAGSVIFDTAALTMSASGSWDISLAIIGEGSGAVRCTVRAVLTGASTGEFALYTRLTGLSLGSSQLLAITGQAGGAGVASNDIVATEGAGWIGVGSASTIYDVTFAYPGIPPNSYTFQVLMFPRAVEFAANFAGAYGYCGTNPTATALYTIYKNGASCGTVSISTSGVFTFTTAAAAVVDFIAGDRLSIQSPGTDLTLADVTFTFPGIRT